MVTSIKKIYRDTYTVYIVIADLIRSQEQQTFIVFALEKQVHLYSFCCIFLTA